jgi:DNA gyrase/topoisomerase IV subunit A
METILVLLAMLGSILHLIDKIAALIKRSKKQSESFEELEARRLLETSAYPERAADPVTREAEAKAEEAMAKAKLLALAAVDASGREKSRLIEEARRHAERAKEFRRVARGELELFDHPKKRAAKTAQSEAQRTERSEMFEVICG